jgi:maltooligosyltrehalose trehalohydrolase
MNDRQWRPCLGAWPDGEGTRFRVWAPKAKRVEVVVQHREGKVTAFPLEGSDDGYFSSTLAGVVAGDRYHYQIAGQEPLPDPVSRFQPEGPHRPSEVIDPDRFAWTDSGWPGVPLEKLVLYELHVGTFSQQGTYDGVVERLEWLAELGVTAIELMPLAECAGSRNWGYDGVGLFAPSHHYGRPDDLRRLVDRAHALGLGVFLDVVYNHLGPDGNYLSRFSPHYFTKRHKTVWGAALNFDGKHSRPVREFFIENALHWVHEYHIDGLRLDATHAIVDDSPRHFLAELSARLRESTPDRHVLLIAEDHRNLKQMLLPEDDGGWGLDGVWADDLHHQVRRRLAGDDEGYYRDFTGSTKDLAQTVRRGWFYCGQHSAHWDEHRGTDPTGVPLTRFVHCIQNHDQIGNRAFGERLHHQIDAAAYRAATVLLLTAPATPLLFMGQEWGAGSPFLFFTDHEPELGKKVTQGRRREFKDFSSFSDPQRRKQIPDPQAEETFLASRLNWEELDQPEHAMLLRLFRRLLALRHSEPALARAEAVSAREPGTEVSFEVVDFSESTIGMRRKAPGEPAVLVLVHLPDYAAPERGVQAETVDVRRLLGGDEVPEWELLLSTEDDEFTADPMPPEIDLSSGSPRVRFSHPGGVILRVPPRNSRKEIT